MPSQSRYSALQLSVMNGELPNMYFILLDDKEIGTEFGELSTNIRTYISQAYTSFVMGMTDIESDSAWEEYKQGLEAIGLSRYLEITNQVAAEQQ